MCGYAASGRWQPYVGAPLGVAMLAWWATQAASGGGDPIGWLIFGLVVALSLFSGWLTAFKLAWAVTVAGGQLELRLIAGTKSLAVSEVQTIRMGRLGLPVIRTDRSWFAVQIRGSRERSRFASVAERLGELGVASDLRRS